MLCHQFPTFRKVVTFVIKVVSQKTLISSSSVVTSQNLVRFIKTFCQLSNLSGVNLRNIEVATVDFKLVCIGRKREIGDRFRFLGAKFCALKVNAVRG